jgi:alpha-L-arabinofuranosidase
MMGDGDGKIRRPTYQVLRLYAEHSGSVRLKSTVQTPTFPWVNPHNPRKEHWVVPYVSGMATLNSDGKTIHLILVNKHPQSVAKVAVTITGGAGPGEVGLTCLEADSGNPERCQISQSKLMAQGDEQRRTFTVNLPPQSVCALDMPGK